MSDSFDEWRVLRSLVSMGAITRQEVAAFEQKMLEIGPLSPPMIEYLAWCEEFFAKNAIH